MRQHAVDGCDHHACSSFGLWGTDRVQIGGAEGDEGVAVAVFSFADLLDWPGWAAAISPFDHIAPRPAQNDDTHQLLWLGAFTLALLLVGAVGYRRRPIGSELTRSSQSDARQVDEAIDVGSHDDKVVCGGGCRDHEVMRPTRTTGPLHVREQDGMGRSHTSVVGQDRDACRDGLDVALPPGPTTTIDQLDTMEQFCICDGRDHHRVAIVDQAIEFSVTTLGIDQDGGVEDQLHRD